MCTSNVVKNAYHIEDIIEDFSYTRGLNNDHHHT